MLASACVTVPEDSEASKTNVGPGGVVCIDHRRVPILMGVELPVAVVVTIDMGDERVDDMARLQRTTTHRPNS